MLTRLTHLARRTRTVAARRRSSGAWSAVAAPAREPTVEAPAPRETYADACASAREHLHAGRASDAVREARRALESLPRGVDAQRLLGLALLEAGDARPAANAFAAALGADPLDVVAQVGLAESIEKLEGPGAAEAAWRRAWELEPGIDSVGERLQAARRAAGVLDVRSGPPPLTRAALTRIHLRGRLFEHAAVEARAVLAREPERVDMRLSLAEACWRAGEVEAAGAVAAEIVERQPECIAATLLLAAHWQTEGRDASEFLARVQAIDPDGAIAQRLFDDREVPALNVAVPIGTLVEPALEPPAEVPAEPALAETQPLAVVEPPPREVMVEAPIAEPVPVEPLESRQPIQADELIELIPEPQIEADAEPEPGSEPEPETEPGPRPQLQPEVLSAAVTTPPVEPPAAAPGHRAAGDEAMRSGSYFEAARAYGAWLRELRGASSPTSPD